MPRPEPTEWHFDIESQDSHFGLENWPNTLANAGDVISGLRESEVTAAATTAHE